MEGGIPYAASQQPLSTQKSKSIHGKSTRLPKYRRRVRQQEYKLLVPLKSQKIESESEMEGVCVASQTGVNLPRLAVAQTHPNPRAGLCVPLDVDRAWELPSEHKRQIVISRSPPLPLHPLSHHHLLLHSPPRTSYFR